MQDLFRIFFKKLSFLFIDKVSPTWYYIICIWEQNRTFTCGEMAEWSKAPALKTGDVKASVGSNPTLSAKILYLQKYPSGRRGSPAKGVGCVKSAARVQIPPSAPREKPVIAMVTGFFLCVFAGVFPYVFPYQRFFP